jgi:hypothetical protein
MPIEMSICNDYCRINGENILLITKKSFKVNGLQLLFSSSVRVNIEKNYNG